MWNLYILCIYKNLLRRTLCFTNMNTAVINLRVEPKVKKDAQRIARKMGLSLSNVLDGLLRQFIEEKAITYQVPEILNEKSQKALDRSMEDVKAGRVTSFKNPDEMFAYLDKMIAKKKCASNN